LLDLVGLSERQRQRAAEAIKAQRGFWDRIDHRALLYLCQEDGALGLVVLEGVPQDVTPAESDRLLPLGAGFLLSHALRRKRMLMTSLDGEIPEYLSMIIREAEGSGQELDDVHVLRLGFRGGLRGGLEADGLVASSVLHAAEIIRRQTAPGEDGAVEPVGFCPGAAWFLIPSSMAQNFDGVGWRLVSGSMSLSLRRTSLRGALGGSLSFGSALLSKAPESRWAPPFARGLGSALLSPDILGQIRQVLGIDPAFSDQDQRPWWHEQHPGGPGGFSALFVIDGHTDSGAAGWLMDGKRILHQLSERLSAAFPDVGLQGLRQAGERAFLLAGDLPVRCRNREAFGAFSSLLHRLLPSLLSEDAGSGPAMATAGFAALFQPFVTRENLLFSSIWALWHARLLEDARGQMGQLALFDHLTLNVKGDTLVSWGDLAGGIRAYRQGLRLRPDDVNLANSLGATLASMGRRSQAGRLFEEVLRQRPDDFMALYNLSGLYQDAGRLDEAAALIERAVERRPDDLAASLRMAELEMRRGNLDAAERVCSRLMERARASGQVPAALVRLSAQVFYLKGDWAAAKERFKQLLNSMKRDPLSLYFLARGYLEFEGDRKTAARFLEKVGGAASLPSRLRRGYRELEKGLKRV
jgi:tetratricopeptide (TPR) repeat protein